MIYLELLYNFGVLIALSVISGFVAARWRGGPGAALLQGLLFGCAAVIGMLRPLVWEPGLIFDGRSVMISLAGLFFGPLAALVAAAMTAVVRTAQGGIGATMGVLVISASAVIGILFHRRRPPVITVRHLLALGFSVHIAMLLLMFTIPGGKSLAVLDSIGPPVITVYPLITVLIGWVLARQEEERRQEQALQESNALYRSLIETTDTGFVVLRESDGTVLDANQVYVVMSGHRRREEIIGRSVVEWTAPHDRERNAAEVRKCLATGKVNNLEVDYRHADGTIVPVEINASVVETGRGRVIQTLCRDISERKAAEAELRSKSATLQRVNEELLSLDEMKTRFLANISHELRTPLVAIRGYTEMLLEGGTEQLSERQRENMRIVLRNIDRLTALFDNLFEFARSQSGQSALDRGIFPLAPFLQDIADTLQPRARARNLTLVLSAVAPGLTVYADRQKLGQVLLNLVDNAVKFTPAGGRVTLGAQADAAAVRISVADTGIGISEADRERVFERFFQVDASVTRSYSGAGLGLAIVREIINRHGGTITVQSQPGAGATFMVTLPQPAAVS